MKKAKSARGPQTMRDFRKKQVAKKQGDSGQEAT
jgi:hypothetical protein